MKIKRIQMNKIQFQCDYNEGAHQRILEALTETNMVQTPGYGEDEYCDEARSIIRDLCGRPDADVHFLVGGTQTNATVISSILKPYQGVLCASSGHINVHETGAIEHGGHKVLALPAENGKISGQQICTAMESHLAEDGPEHMVQPGMVYLSFPTETGTIYQLEELKSIRKACDRYGLPLFIDGARLGYGLMSEACDLTIKEIAAISDVFYIGGTKQGALFGEAVVIGNDNLKKDFRYCIKQGGGMLAKGRLLGIQFRELLRDGLYFDLAAKADRLAMRIREAFKAKGYTFLVDSPTNQQFPILSAEDVRRLEKDFVFSIWQNVDEDRIAVRFCTSWATPDSSVDRLIAAI